jgi:two-component system, response regulator PdtaR
MTYDPDHDTILIVEDEALLREFTSDLFEDEGYRVVTAPNADDAVRFLLDHDKVNVVFTDVNMPGSMNGAQFAQYIAKQWPRIGIVVVSGRPLADAIPLGARFHYKPIDSETVLREVRQLVVASRI